jgi:hypothetical protein
VGGVAVPKARGGRAARGATVRDREPVAPGIAARLGEPADDVSDHPAVVIEVGDRVLAP